MKSTPFVDSAVDVAKGSNTIENSAEKIERPGKKTLFNDLVQFNNLQVSIIMHGGEVIKGKLVGYDEVANCVLEEENKNLTVLFGKSIVMICEGCSLSL